MSAWQRAQFARRWFRALRRTRPFWGALWMAFGGYTILKYSMAPLQVIAKTGMTGVAGYVLGGGLIFCGLVALCIPSQRYAAGLIGIVLAVVSLVASNLGGFFVGMLAGVLGGSMTLGWGVKKPRRRDVRRAAAGGAR